MPFNFFLTGLKAGIATAAVVLLGSSLVPSIKSDNGPDIFHHWPPSLAFKTAGAIPSPDIFHHWPNPGVSTTTAEGVIPDIFHHWPNIVLSGANNDKDDSPDIFHHWPHDA